MKKGEFTELTTNFTEDIKETPENTTQEEINKANKESVNYNWYERFTMKRILSKMRKQLIKHHDKKNRPKAIKLITAAQTFMFIGPDNSETEYTKEELEQLPIEEIIKILQGIIQELEVTI